MFGRQSLSRARKSPPPPSGTALAPKLPVPPNAGAALAVHQLGATLAPKPPVPRVAIPNPPELAPNSPPPPPKPPPVDAPPVAGAKLKEAAAAAPVDVTAPPKRPKDGAGAAAEVEEEALVADVAAPDPPVAGAKLKEASAHTRPGWSNSNQSSIDMYNNDVGQESAQNS